VKVHSRVAIYVVLGAICFVLWLPVQVVRMMENPSLPNMAGVILTLALAFMLLASITRLEARVKKLEEYLRIAACRERSREQDKVEAEPEA
jgi:hypothetical protein